uniref:Uncharacterized protein n=1 Tax=Guillardia theta TaxID=55529 RepID=A0A7S4NUZ1_GUITH|mmetsp:Transcript_35251/g.110126  ORF Transcript_35251/g.110126 Transcript_35251/m.110126 type:complete len:150 (+) Transcript_35251:288-737(+)
MRFLLFLIAMAAWSAHASRLPLSTTRWSGMRGGGQEAAGVALRGSVSHAVVSDEAEGGEGGEGGGGDFISWEISESLRELQRARSARVKEAARSDKDEHVLRVITLEGQELDISVSFPCCCCCSSSSSSSSFLSLIPRFYLPSLSGLSS